MELDITSAIHQRSKQQKKDIEERVNVLSKLLLSFQLEQPRPSYIGGTRNVRVFPTYDPNAHLTRIDFTIIGADLVRHIIEQDNGDFIKMVELLYHKKQFDEFIHYLTHTILPGALNGSVRLDSLGSLYEFYIKRNLQ